MGTPPVQDSQQDYPSDASSRRIIFRANKSFDDHDGSDHSLGFVYYAGIFVLAGNREHMSKGFARTKKTRIERLGSGWIRDLCRLDG